MRRCTPSANQEVLVRCSSCEPLLDRYVEATLTRAQMLAVTKHLQTCADCRGLLDELKVVDGLLFTTRVPELAPNFTFAVMAEIGGMPAPRARQHPVWSFLALYSAAAWVAAVCGFVLSGTSPQSALANLSSVAGQAGIASSGFAGGVGHGLSHTLPSLAAFAIVLLVIDAAMASAFAFFYVVLRPRLAARIVPSREALS